MRATNRKDMLRDEFLPLEMKSVRHFRNVLRSSRLFSTFLGLALLLVFWLSGCAPSKTSDSASSDIPELTEEIIRERINDATVWEVPEENRAAEPISWRFDEDEPKEITVIEKKIDGTRATILLDIKTGTAPNRRNLRSLAGQIRTEWELKTGWALRRWEITDTENISMKYKDLPKPPSAQNSNR
jgi:hypothetical protein